MTVERRAVRLMLAVAVVITTALALPARPAPAATSLAVHVVGNRLVGQDGQPLRLLGVNRSGAEYACIQGWGMFDGPVDDASVGAIAAWHANAVRIPLNEDCWLGINGVAGALGGASYQAAIHGFVDRLHAAGLFAILDLHWNGAGSAPATGQQVMADADHSPAFWSSVAASFVQDPAVVFDLYNEPHDISWSCWRDGCTTPAGWATAGMQSLVDAVRATGATQPVLVGGLGWAGDLSQWLAWRPLDPAGQVAASVHTYNFASCVTAACWASEVTPVAAAVPVVAGEVGENDCAHTFTDAFMDWADQAGVSYLGWSWNTASCTAGPSLITAYDGTPSPFGVGLHDRLAALATAPTAAPPPTPAPGAPVAGPPVPTTPPPGGWAVTAAGRVTALGGAPFFGDLDGRAPSAPVVALGARPAGRGYWVAAADGSVAAFGDAPPLGDMRFHHLNQPIVAMAVTASGNGYWLLGGDGGIFSFGDAVFHGSTGAMRLNAPVIDMAATPSGGGYWLVARDGGIFSFGDAGFFGSTGNMRLNQPVTSITAVPGGGGYWFIAEDGGVFSFGPSARFAGSLPGVGDTAGGRRMRAVAGRAGYEILGVGGRVFPFGGAAELGWAPAGVVDLALLPA